MHQCLCATITITIITSYTTCLAENVIILSKTKEHNKYNLVNNDGLNDLLGVLISMKNIQVKEKFNKLIDDISDLIDSYIKNNNVVSKEELLKEMSLPDNFYALKW